MNNSIPNTMTIDELKSLNEVVNFEEVKNEIIVFNDNIKYVDFFKYPCRLDAFILAVCTNGTLKATINLKKYEITKNMVVFNLPNNIIQVEHAEDLSVKGIIVSTHFINNIHIDLRKIIPLYMQIHNQTVEKLSDENLAIINSYLTLIRDVVKAQTSSNRINILSGLGVALMFTIAEILEQSEPAKAALIDYSKNRKVILFEQFTDLILQNFRKERTIGFYADKLNITPKYLSSIIKEVSGKSAAEWIDESVILEAKTLLKFSDMSIQEIAYHLNFSTQSFFGKYFKHLTGMSPTEYKKL